MTDSLADRYTRLRDYLENCSVQANGDAPLNPGGRRRYIIICTHCHYDHIGGITQFLEGGTTEIVASAAGRDFIESDLDSHSLFKWLPRPTPYYQMTKWAQTFERLSWPFKHEYDDAGKREKQQDLGITIIQVPGHTPDSLAWYDHDEMHLYVGDSLYREGVDRMPIIWPGQGGNMIEWFFSMQKLQYLIHSENSREDSAVGDDGDVDGWVSVPRAVLVSCGHATTGTDGKRIMAEVDCFWAAALRGQIPLVSSRFAYGEVTDTWRAKGLTVSFSAPRRLMEDARKFFLGSVEL